jgi:hypothetical protein
MKNHCSASQLMKFHQYGFHEAVYRIENPSHPTAAMQFGSLVDALYYDVERDRFVPWPIDNGKPLSANSNAFKAAAASLGDDRQFVKQADMDAAERAVESLHANTFAESLWENSIRQNKLTWENSGVEFHGVPDAYNGSGISDLKTTDKIDQRSFIRKVMQMGYHIQAYLYVNAVQQLTGMDLPFHWVVQCNRPPYEVVVYRADDEIIWAGEGAAKIMLDKWVDWHNESYDKYAQQELVTLMLPEWA